MLPSLFGGLSGANTAQSAQDTQNLMLKRVYDLFNQSRPAQNYLQGAYQNMIGMPDPYTGQVGAPSGPVNPLYQPNIPGSAGPMFPQSTAGQTGGGMAPNATKTQKPKKKDIKATTGLSGDALQKAYHQAIVDWRSSGKTSTGGASQTIPGIPNPANAIPAAIGGLVNTPSASMLPGETAQGIGQDNPLASILPGETLRDMPYGGGDKGPLATPQKQGYPVANQPLPDFMQIDWRTPFTPEQMQTLSQGNLMNASDILKSSQSAAQTALTGRGLMGPGVTSSMEGDQAFKTELLGRKLKNQANIGTMNAVLSRGDQLRGEQNTNWKNLFNVLQGGMGQQMAPWADVAGSIANAQGQQAGDAFGGLGSLIGSIFGNKGGGTTLNVNSATGSPMLGIGAGGQIGVNPSLNPGQPNTMFGGLTDQQLYGSFLRG